MPNVTKFLVLTKEVNLWVEHFNLHNKYEHIVRWDNCIFGIQDDLVDFCWEVLDLEDAR